MSANDEGLWNGKWQIVRADLDLAHVFAPQDTISFVRNENGRGYKVAHKGSAPDAHCFNNTVFSLVDGARPSVAALERTTPLPLFSAVHKQLYRDLADKLEAYAQTDPGVQHLEGTMQIPCHRHPHQAQENTSEQHDIRVVPAKIRVYQFPDAVTDGKRLLVIYRPLESTSASNGNGTVIAYE